MDARQHFNRSSGCSEYDVDNGQTSWLADGDVDRGISIIRQLFGLGITEYHEESMCLFQYQLGQFNSNRCNYKYLEKIKGDRSSKIWSTDKTHHSFETELGMRDLLHEHITKDMQLWSEAMRIFAARVRHVERETGVTLLNPSDPIWSTHPASMKPEVKGEIKADIQLAKEPDSAPTLKRKPRPRPVHESFMDTEMVLG